MASLVDSPIALSEPLKQIVPFVFASPHSGCLYPTEFLNQSRLSALSLRRSEDAFVDELFSSAVRIGAPLLAARFPRAFLDVNRSPAELDPSMFDGPLAIAADTLSPRVHAGLGVIPRIVRDGAEIYRDKLSAREATERLARFHQPYHAELARLMDTTRAEFGVAVLLDCHSMPSAAAAPDIVLGDRYGLSAAAVITRSAERAFEVQGFRVVRNVPYAGGYTTLLHGRPARRQHALQIEINRGLYLDEERMVALKTFPDIARRISHVLLELSLLARELQNWPPTAQAAE